MTTADSLPTATAGGLVDRFVVFDQRGLQLPALGTRPATLLRLPELLVLARCSSRQPVDLAQVVDEVAAATGADAARLTAFLDRLAPPERWAAEPRLIPDAATTGPDPADASASRGLDDTSLGEVWVRAIHPLVLHIDDGRFHRVDHDGHPIDTLTAAELAFLAELRRPEHPRKAVAALAAAFGEAAPDEAGAEAVLRRSLASGLVEITDDPAHAATGSRIERTFTEAMTRVQARQSSAHAWLVAFDEQEQAREAATGVARTWVVPVNSQSGFAQPALGMLLAHAKAHRDGALEERYAFVPDWGRHPRTLERSVERPAIFLFSNYLWNHRTSLTASAEVKARNPQNVTIHGGPDTPKYARDVDAYFAANPHVDITVHAEGEATFVHLLEALATSDPAGPIDLSVLHDVPGLSFRHGGDVVQTGDRDRITDLDSLPSPYLTGLYEPLGPQPSDSAIIETNRGCPYGCTFCDWGSSTMSRIRKFSLDRVMAELEWCATHQIPLLYIADANFGIFERDVEITRRVAELKEQYGYPQLFVTNYAKNTVKHLRQIVEILASAGILTEGLLSLQSMDTGTLDVIKRSNIRLDRYEDLAREFRRADLPLWVDIMVGLPGSTVDSFTHDLQECIDREVRAKVLPTELLVNSPMNDPDYRATHQIETAVSQEQRWSGELPPGRDKALVVAAATFTRGDYDEMLRRRTIFLLCENLGVLRIVARYVRHETALEEMDFYLRLADDVAADPERWPVLAFTFEVVTQTHVPPGCWQFFVDELRRYLVEVTGLADDAALDTVLRTHHALLPDRGRAFPCRVPVDHDIGAWYQAVLATKEADHLTDWPDHAPHLATFGPAVIEIDDPHDVCTLALATDMEYDPYSEWELASPVARPTTGRHRFV